MNMRKHALLALGLLTMRLSGLSGGEPPPPMGPWTQERSFKATDEKSDPLVFALAISPDGNYAACGHYNGELSVWDLTTGVRKWSLLKNGRPWSLAFSRDGALLGGALSSEVVVWEMKQGREIKRIKGQIGIDFSPTASLAATGRDADVIVVNPMTGETVKTFKGHTKTVVGVCFAQSGRRLVSCARDKTVRIWDLAAGKEIGILKPDEDDKNKWSVLKVMLSSDEKRLLTINDSGPVRLWDTSVFNGKQAQPLTEVACNSVAIAFGRGQWICETDHTLRVRTFEKGNVVEEQAIGEPEPSLFTRLAISKDEKRLVGGDYDGKLTVFAPKK
jgi:WD40 repeat protein